MIKMWEWMLRVVNEGMVFSA